MAAGGDAGGGFGVGKRIQLAHTRAMVDAIHGGQLVDAKLQRDPLFGFDVVRECPGVPPEILIPRNAWGDAKGYEVAARRLAELFRGNFRNYEGGAAPEVRAAGPVT